MIGEPVVVARAVNEDRAEEAEALGTTASEALEGEGLKDVSNDVSRGEALAIGEDAGADEEAAGKEDKNTLVSNRDAG